MAVPSTRVMKVPPLNCLCVSVRSSSNVCRFALLPGMAGLNLMAAISSALNRSSSSLLTTAATIDAVEDCWSPNSRPISSYNIRLA